MIRQLGILGLAGLLAGCSTVPQRETYHVHDFVLVTDTHYQVNKAYQSHTLHQNPQIAVGGFQVNKMIYVRYSSDKDINGEQLPDFNALGHEVWHLVKGGWHE
jgi:hypothetical protein